MRIISYNMLAQLKKRRKKKEKVVNTQGNDQNFPLNFLLTKGGSDPKSDK